MTPAPSRHFVRVGQRLVHYTRMGTGPAVALLHASATSSGEMAQAQSVFARDFCAIAFDTLGYGLSDPLQIARAPELEDYADALAETLTALGIGRLAVYGRHTGASIAVEFARRHPARCTMVLTDGYPIWTEAERAKMLGAYLPALTQSWEGAHLLWSWFRYRDQHAFWPWFDRRAAARATRDVPPLAFIHRGALELLQAGDGYRVGYSAAFRHDGAAALAGIEVPVCLGTRPTDLIHPMRDRAPPGSWRVEMPGDALAAAVAERALLAIHPAGPPPDAPPCAAVPSRCTPNFLEVNGNRLLMRQAGEDGPETLLLIPEIPGGTAAWALLLDAMRTKAIAIDLPGLGESDAADGFVPDVEAWAACLLAALDAAGVGQIGIFAHRGGCAVAVALAALAPARVAGVVLSSPPAVAAEQRTRLIDSYAPEIEPTWDGSHLLRVWHHLRDQEFWWPWFDQKQAAALHTDPAVSPDTLTIRALACLRQPQRYRPAWQVVWRYDLLGALAALPVPVRVGVSEGDAFGHLATAAATVLGQPVEAWPEFTASFLDSLAI